MISQELTKQAVSDSLGAFLSLSNSFYTYPKVLKFAALFLCPGDSKIAKFQDFEIF